MREQEKLSKQLENVIAFFRTVKQEYEYDYGQVGEQDKLKCDLLHSIELTDVDYATRCKTATKLRKCLKTRRYYKDMVEERKAIVDFLNKTENKRIFDALAKVLGDTRTVERYHKNRSYTPRIEKMSVLV
ncbi:MAG: hypothetical protein PHC62_10180 [Candidatus Izemoplasmatales bacterium]|nr:hypothetical protein [Candidatus Izemoplasmatales bacterium]